MTPAARVQAAIEVLDQIRAGKPAERALTGWARRSRYAGSKDRAAVRDHVFDALRCKRSFAALGGADTGRGMMLGALRAAGQDPDHIFGSTPHAPPPLMPQETQSGRAPHAGPEALDVPDWLWPLLVDSLGADASAYAQILKTRAPVHLRVNLRKTSREDARIALASDGIETRPHASAETALEIRQGARRLRQCQLYLDGRVELQDGASQAVVQELPLRDGMRVLDYCAGGGGKALAMAARADIELFVHDAAPQRMQDLPARADRAGVRFQPLAGAELDRHGPFDLILCDVPCSGSGAWRRSPEGKWSLSATKLHELQEIQADILARAAALVSGRGVLCYATCSVLNVENSRQIDQFAAANPAWQPGFNRTWMVQNGTDGFFTAHLTRIQGTG
ncbi:RsmB/NOP family class I SAM-dependent RNA methyltransferase [Rhodobacteraceae bacterium F11138]|nr:RsmB/NOP family class I SAM-dependent RNA methyltransferase [Rhodobacteraceae bacterium F11138]